MTPIHGRVSRGGGVMLTRGRRHSGGGTGGMGGLRGGYAYTERIAGNRVLDHAATSFQAPASSMHFEGKR
jgi:hypothetical protein